MICVAHKRILISLSNPIAKRTVNMISWKEDMYDLIVKHI